MPDLEMPAVLIRHVRLRALIQAFLAAMEDECDESQPSDYALMRALLFRIGLELGRDVGAAASRACSKDDALPRVAKGRRLLAEGASALEHLHDIEQALTALEVLGDPYRLAFRTQALLFVEWQLAHLAQVAETPGPASTAETARKTTSLRVPAHDRALRTSHGLGSIDLRDGRLLRDSLARAGGVVRRDVAADRVARLAV